MVITRPFTLRCQCCNWLARGGSYKKGKGSGRTRARQLHRHRSTEPGQHRRVASPTAARTSLRTDMLFMWDILLETVPDIDRCSNSLAVTRVMYEHAPGALHLYVVRLDVSLMRLGRHLPATWEGRQGGKGICFRSEQLTDKYASGDYAPGEPSPITALATAQAGGMHRVKGHKSSSRLQDVRAANAWRAPGITAPQCRWLKTCERIRAAKRLVACTESRQHPYI